MDRRGRVNVVLAPFVMKACESFTHRNPVKYPKYRKYGRSDRFKCIQHAKPDAKSTFLDYFQTVQVAQTLDSLLAFFLYIPPSLSSPVCDVFPVPTALLALTGPLEQLLKLFSVSICSLKHHLFKKRYRVPMNKTCRHAG